VTTTPEIALEPVAIIFSFDDTFVGFVNGEEKDKVSKSPS
jgi:hypothetical protein